VILLYHNLVSGSAPKGIRLSASTMQQDVFKRHINWLKKHFEIVSLENYLESWRIEDYSKKIIAITFDDGMASSFSCLLPIIEQYQIPVTIFVTTCHLNNGEIMDGNYLNAVCFEEIYSEIKLENQILSLKNKNQRKSARRLLGSLFFENSNPHEVIQKIKKNYPIPNDLHGWYQGMTNEQLITASISPFVEIGAHSVNHPNLDLLSSKEQELEIIGSKNQLSDITGQDIRYFAYPRGAYNKDTLKLMERLGFEAAFATTPKNKGKKPEFELGRVGVYSSSILKLHLKAIGFRKYFSN